MRLTFIQHIPYAGPGLIREFAEAKGWVCDGTLTPEDPRSLELANVPGDAVVFLGSTHGVYDTHVPWIARERRLMRGLVASSRPVLGVCFGAQMLGTALGGRVMPMPQPYQGWCENEDAVDDLWRGPWLRWHGDRIFLPGSVEVFARNDETVQAFRQGCAVGVQFHPEVDGTVLTDWIASGSTGNLISARRYADDHAKEIRDRAFALLDRIFAMLK
jgi:GMP synthase (glutamine-hydrolysing)